MRVSKSLNLRVAGAVALAIAVFVGCVSSSWDAVRKRDTVAAYNQFLRDHPNSSYAAEARQRMAAQMDQAEKAERADYVIDNGDTLEAGREATRIVCERLQLDLMRWMASSSLGPAG